MNSYHETQEKYVLVRLDCVFREGTFVSEYGRKHPNNRLCDLQCRFRFCMSEATIAADLQGEDLGTQPIRHRFFSHPL